MYIFLHQAEDYLRVSLCVYSFFFNFFSLVCFRRINVTGFGPATPCAPAVAPQRYYIIFAEVRPSPDGTGSILAARYDDIFAAIANWTEGNEKLVWSGAGEFLSEFILINKKYFDVPYL